MAYLFAVDSVGVMTIVSAIIEALYQACRKLEFLEYDLLNHLVRTERNQTASFRTISYLPIKSLLQASSLKQAYKH